MILPRVVQVSIIDDRFQIHSRAEDSDEWTLHASGKLVTGGVRLADASRSQALSRCTEPVPVSEFYESMAAQGLQFGESFRGIQQLWRGDGEAVGQVRAPDTDVYRFHPALLDACFQVIGAAANVTDLYLPVAIRSLQVAARPASELWCHARRRSSSDAATITGDLIIFDADGAVIAEVEGFTLKRVDRAALASFSPNAWQDWLYEVEWKPQEIGETKPSSPRRWLILTANDGMGPELAKRLESLGHTCDVATELPEQIGYHGIVHLLPFDTAGTLGLVQRLAAMERPPRLWFITDDSPEQATLWGLGRVIAAEHPALRCVLVEASDAVAVCAELFEDGRENQVAIAGGTRTVARLARLPASRRTKAAECVRLEISPAAFSTT